MNYKKTKFIEEKKVERFWLLLKIAVICFLLAPILILTFLVGEAVGFEMPQAILGIGLGAFIVAFTIFMTTDIHDRRL